MIAYHKEGNVSTKKHTAFYDETTKKLYREELFGSCGFEGIYSIKYHQNIPPAVTESIVLDTINCHWEKDMPLQAMHFKTHMVNDGDILSSKISYCGNDRVTISIVTPTKNQDYYYKNAGCNECYYVHEGHGCLYSEFGEISFKEGDYIFIPKSMIYKLLFNSKKNKLLLIESVAHFRIPNEFKNNQGQILEHAPYSERDFKTPTLKEPYIEESNVKVIVKKNNKLTQLTLQHSPFDLVGWDGYLYPCVFNINDYSPIVGKIHQPPSVHKVIECDDFMVTNFVPRLLDYHQNAIPIPYYHSNIDCDEILYYLKGNFMSRNGIEEGSITLHPSGIPHGPQPGKIEASLGAKEVNEYAIMIDVYREVFISPQARSQLDKNYFKSWVE